MRRSRAVNASRGRNNSAAPGFSGGQSLIRSDFDAKAAAFAKAVAENNDNAKSSLVGLKAAIPVVGKTCDDCHKEYRLSKQ